MKTPDCERYIEDPEANASHLETCEDCRALFGADAAVRTPKIDVQALPLAPWEGAQHRSWPLVGAAAVAIFALAAALFTASGASPADTLLANIPTLSRLQALVVVMRQAPIMVVGVLFVVVNTLLIALLRRSPRGLSRGLDV
ncbi:MAG TPA: hypothetical protein VH087_20810 [Thermoanaerobaculia bacterium]|jgi:hypothetical protein|nr:hypothetical protein [Thermoanaerobaculia bacterium]